MLYFNLILKFLWQVAALWQLFATRLRHDYKGVRSTFVAMWQLFYKSRKKNEFRRNFKYINSIYERTNL